MRARIANLDQRSSLPRCRGRETSGPCTETARKCSDAIYSRHRIPEVVCVLLMCDTEFAPLKLFSS